MTTAEVAAALAARNDGRTEGPWFVERYPDDDRDMGTLVSAPDGTIIADYSVGNEHPNRHEDALAIVVAVNLAEPLWRVAEAAREVDAGWHSIEEGANVRMRYASDLPSRLAALREALADLAANVEEMP